jgi:membrane protease YdiL (CAAX protease family)
MTEPVAARPQGVAYTGAPATTVDALAAGRDLRPARWGLADVAVLVIGGILLPLIILSVLLAAGLPQHSGAFLLLAAATPWLVFAGWPLLTTHLQGNGVRIDLGYSVEVSDIWWGLGGGVACFLLATPVGILTERVFGDFDSAAGTAALAADTSRVVLVLYALMVLIGAPLVEELAFRGLVFTAVAKHTAAAGGTRTRVLVWAGVWSTLLFAGIHLEPVRVPVLLVIGAVLAFLRARTGRVGAGVIAHAVNNLPGAIALALLGT